MGLLLSPWEEISHILFAQSNVQRSYACPHPAPDLEVFTEEQDCSSFIRHELHLDSTPRKGSLFICHLFLCSLHTVFSTSIDRMTSVTKGRTQKFAAWTKQMSEWARQMATGQVLSQLLFINWSSTQCDTSLSWIVTPALLVVKWPYGTQKGDLKKVVTSEKSKTTGWSMDLRCQLRYGPQVPAKGIASFQESIIHRLPHPFRISTIIWDHSFKFI